MVKKESELLLKTKLILPLKNVSKNSEILKVKMPLTISRKTSSQAGTSKMFMARIKSTSPRLILCYKTFESFVLITIYLRFQN